MLIKLHDKNPSERDLRRIVEVLERDGVVIYPTDSLYAYGCSLRSPRAMAAAWAAVATRDFPEPVGVARMTWLPPRISRMASSWAS